MLELVIVDSESRAAVLPEGAEAGVQVWREHGEVCAYGYAAAGANWLHLPRVATFRFVDESRRVVAVAGAAVPERTVVDAFERTVLPLALQFFGAEALHASAVLGPGGVVALCGDSGVGKSTLAHVLSTRGHELWADDAVVFDPRDGGVVAVPLPFRPMLRPAAVAALGAAALPSGDPAEEPLACLVVLERAPGDSRVSTRRLAAAEALEAAIAHAYCYRPEDLERNRRMMTTYLELVARVPVFELRFATDLEQVGAVAERVEELLVA